MSALLNLDAFASDMRPIVLASATAATFGSDSSQSTTFALTGAEARAWAQKLLKAADDLEAMADAKAKEAAQ